MSARLLFRGLALAATLGAQVAVAATYPSNPDVEFQTSGCQRPTTVGDWYTTAGSASATHYGEFFLVVTTAMAPATVEVLDAESDSTDDEVSGPDDPTRFELLNADGSVVLAGQTVPSGSPDGTIVTFSGLSEGLYRIRSYDGADEMPGASGAYCSAGPGDKNDDDNGFRIRVNGNNAIDGLLGFLQTTYQQNSGAPIDYQMYFLVGPDLADTSLAFRNYDLDGGATGAVYNKPPAASGTQLAGTISGNGAWNGPSPGANSGEDDVAVDNHLSGGSVDAGVWGYRIEGWTSGNQTIFEANHSGQRLALTDVQPTHAGFFALSPSGTLNATVGVAVDHPFTVANQFFANDLVNFSLAGTAPGYATQLRSDPNCDGDGSDGAPLVDSDGDGKVDSGLLAAFGAAGATKCFVLRVTPGASVTGDDTTTVSAVSFLDARVSAASTVRSIARTTTFVPGPVTVSSSAAVISDPLHGANSPLPIPGAVIEYTLTINNPNGAHAMDTLVLSDVVPAGASYVAGSLVVGGTAEDDDASGADESDPDGGDFNISAAGTVTAEIPALAAGSSTTVVFRVKLN